MAAQSEAIFTRIQPETHGKPDISGQIVCRSVAEEVPVAIEDRTASVMPC